MLSFIYKWHRRFSMVIAIPVLLWAISGLMHPIMTNIRPAVVRQAIPAAAIGSHRVRVSLREALRMHHIDSIAGFRLVHIDTSWFYQVQPAWSPALSGAGGAIRPAVPVYLSCLNGNVLTAGDWLYAQWLARQFLEGASAEDTAMAPAIYGHSGMVSGGAHDCCGAATEYVLNPGKGAPVDNVSMIGSYDHEYKSINRLLPVYRVSFHRSDGIRIYVETIQDRFAFAMDNKRAIFDEIFRLFHTYGWLEWMGRGRIMVELSLALLAFCTTVMGIYIFFVTRSPKSSASSPLVRARRRHRLVSIIACLFTMMWTFSGAWHAFARLSDDTRDLYFARSNFAAALAAPDIGRLQGIIPAPITNISIVDFDGQPCWRVKADSIVYVRISDYSAMADGDARYASWLSFCFSGRPAKEVLSVRPVTTFGDEYNFTDKRLPVWKVAYGLPVNERYYIETSTGHLASHVDDRALREGWSFSVFHKHHFMDWGGKTTRDVSTMWWAFAQVVMVIIGLILWFRKRKRSRPLH